MTIRLLDNQEIYNDFILSIDKTSFLQTYQWGEFQKNLGRNILRLGLYSDHGAKDLVGMILLIEHSLPFGWSYFYCPRGPVLKDHINSEAIKIIWSYIKEMASNRGVIFTRIDPLSTLDLGISGTEKNIKPIFSIQPSTELMLKLDFSERELLNSMRSKTRYNIKRAQKNNIDIRISANNQTEFNIFYDLVVKTAARHKMRIYNKEYYESLINTFKEQVKIYTAFDKNHALASNLLIYLGDTVTYLHGGSDFTKHNLMAPYLLHWRAIQDARRVGYKYYNFGGINYMNNKELTGLTRFKTGFVSLDQDSTGMVIKYEKSFDIVYNKAGYLVYKIARPLNKFIKRLKK